MKKNCCWASYKWVIIQNQTVILKTNLKLDLTNYTTKIELNDATGVDTSNLAAKIDFIDVALW